MGDAGKAVFLSYASQDAEAARKICDALRAAGIEVWFDQSELVGGDAWDAKIRRQIKECALFVPIISASTQARLEGYFRIEWKLAAQRTHAMAARKAFLLPIVIDGTRDTEAHVPEEFLTVQWTRLAGGEITPAFCARVAKLVASSSDLETHRLPSGGRDEDRAAPAPAASTTKKRARPVGIAAAVVALAALAAVAIWSPWKKAASTGGAVAPATSAAARLVAKAWEQMDKTEMARNELLLAEGYCRQAAALDDTNPAVWAAWSAMNTWFYFHQFERVPARKEAARDYAQKALALDPKSYEARYAWAHFVVRMAAEGKTSDERPALPILRELLRERADEPRTLYALGFGLICDPANADEGFVTLERLAEKHPWFAGRALNEVGWMSLFHGRFGLAESAADRALKAHPYWNNLGLKATLALRLHGDVKLAQATIDRLPPTALQENWGISLAVTVADWRGDHARAVAILESVSRDWLENFFYAGPTSLLSGWMRLKAKQVTAAEKDFRRALELIAARLEKAPNDVALLWCKAEALRLLGVRDEADKTYRQLREVWPDTFAQVTFEPPEEALKYVQRMVQRSYKIDEFPPGWNFTAASLRLDPMLENVRRAPGFKALLEAEEQREKLQRAQTPATAGAKTVTTLPDKSAVPERSIAVLAFNNLSGDPAREFFSDGLSEAVAEALGRVPGLRVTGSTSAFSFKRQMLSAPEIARQLGVSHLVEGTVLQDGGKVRITAKLIQADGFQVWASERLEREVKNIFAVHDEVAELVAKNLSLQLGVRSKVQREINSDAYELYLLGRQQWNLRTEHGDSHAVASFSRAIELDPKFALAYVGRADARGFLAVRRGQIGTWAQRESPLLTEIAADVKRAQDLEPTLAEAHATLGNLAALRGNYELARQEFVRAIELKPNYATAHQWLSLSDWRAGRLAEARASALRAVEADPLSSVVSAACAIVLHDAGDPAALFHAERAVALQLDSARALGAKVSALRAAGQRDASVAVARSLVGRDVTTQGLGRALFALGAAGLATEVEAARHVGGPFAAIVKLQGASALGKWDEFFAGWSGEALTVDDAWFLYVEALDPVRADPRFLAVLREAGLIEAHARIQAWRAARAKENK